MKLMQRLSVTSLVIGLSLLAGGSAVSATGLPGHSGTYGRHSIADGEEYPGVLCRYIGDGNFHAVRVDPPVVFAADTTAGVDAQKVGWAFRVLALSDDKGAAWTTIYTSSYQIANATDARDAAFTRRSHAFTAAEAPTSNIYRVQILMSWYTAISTTGRARHTVEWYHGGVFEPAFGPNGYCPGFQF